jgi:hypothetical protein
MNRKTLLAIALASAFGLSTVAAYADDEKQETEKPQLIAEDDKKDSPFPADPSIGSDRNPAQLIAEDDKKDSPYPADPSIGSDRNPAQLIADGEEKEGSKPELIA